MRLMSSQPTACHRFAHRCQIGGHLLLGIQEHMPVGGHFGPKPGRGAHAVRQMREMGLDEVPATSNIRLFVPAPVQRAGDRHAPFGDHQYVDVRGRSEFAARPRAENHDADEGIAKNDRRSASNLIGRRESSRRRAFAHCQHLRSRAATVTLGADRAFIRAARPPLLPRRRGLRWWRGRRTPRHRRSCGSWRAGSCRSGFSAAAAPAPRA